MTSMFCFLAPVNSQPTASVQLAGKESKGKKIESPAQWKSLFGGIFEGGQFVIRDPQSWKNLWARISNDDPPMINFKKKMVVAVFLGQKSTGGYSVEIQGLTKQEKKKNSRILVKVKAGTPPAQAMVIQALTSPFHMKVVDRSDGPVDFEFLN